MQAYKSILKLLKYYYLHNSMRIKSAFHIIYFYYILYTIINILMQIRLKFKIETSEVLHLEHNTVWCWNLTLWKVDQKYMESFEMWYWRRMEKISWTDSVRNEEVITLSQGGEEYPTYNKNNEG